MEGSGSAPPPQRVWQKARKQSSCLLQEEMERKIRQRLELRQSYEEQLAMQEVLRKAMEEEEAAFCQAMLAKFAEDDRIEQMNAQKRRMKQLEHRRAVQRLIEERRKQFLADKVSPVLPGGGPHFEAGIIFESGVCVCVCMRVNEGNRNSALVFWWASFMRQIRRVSGSTRGRTS